MLMRTDPFRDLDRLTRQLLGTTSQPAVMPMDAWREEERFVVEFDLPGMNPDSLDLGLDRNVLTVHAERPVREGDKEMDEEMIAAEHPRGVFSRQLFLGENLDTDHIKARYDAGVLKLTILLAEQAKPRKIAINSAHSDGEVGRGHESRQIDA
ncbi:Hsp20 family protein [Rhodococcus sp. IEGM 1379]|uniref:Hsp20/alpha crystallin family protein n=1 Tax=Rhodococcus sp. IEGM 1379 TaxID=3047086 RepID=UPI0024B7BFF2|nr:Hsp20 family protein [Rhodococcus sp. IEGM 1379]MDI9917297.1 Hsp20 family protein [Rhodococcus sp. IEGM 1379]